MPILPPSSTAAQVISSGLPRGTPLSEFITEIGRWMKEAVDVNVPGLTADAINDAIEDLWMIVLRTVMSELLGGPVQLTLAPATERVQIVSVTDPAIAPVVSAAGAAQFVAAYTDVTESGTETNPSPATAPQNIGIGSVMTAPAVAVGAFGYNVYAGADAQHLFRQNLDPIDFNVNFAFTAVVGTDVEANPPAPAFNSTGDNIYLINHLEVATPDGGFTAWNQADIDSTLMRRAARSIPGVSPYGRFLFDYISGGTLEVRPQTGATISSRYFYVNKPRKLRYANAPLPLGHIPSGQSFMRYKAISLLKLVAEEYQASSMWASKAQDEELKIAQSLNRKTMNRNNRVTPLLR